MEILDIQAKTVAIVVFIRERRNVEMAEKAGVLCPRLIHYQVTIDPKLISPNGKHIRFGGPEDEITGWQPVDSLEIVEILAQEEDGQLITLAKAA